MHPPHCVHRFIGGSHLKYVTLIHTRVLTLLPPSCLTAFPFALANFFRDSFCLEEKMVGAFGCFPLISIGIRKSKVRHQMSDNAGCSPIDSPVAEPLARFRTLHKGWTTLYATISTGLRRAPVFKGCAGAALCPLLELHLHPCQHPGEASLGRGHAGVIVHARNHPCPTWQTLLLPLSSLRLWLHGQTTISPARKKLSTE
jgi:hypothetical protein